MEIFRAIEVPWKFGFHSRNRRIKVQRSVNADLVSLQIIKAFNTYCTIGVTRKACFVPNDGQHTLCDLSKPQRSYQCHFRGATGIGASMVEAFARQGAQVVILDIMSSEAAELCKQFAAEKVSKTPIFMNAILPTSKAR